MHIHNEPGQHDLTVSAYILRVINEEINTLFHKHKKLDLILQPGGHVELSEDPWTAVLREILEETGYLQTQLNLLQPMFGPVWNKTSEYNKRHPSPISVSTHRFDDIDHYHTDIAYAFAVFEDPILKPSDGESQNVMWLSNLEINNEVKIPSDVKDICNFLFFTESQKMFSVRKIV